MKYIINIGENVYLLMQKSILRQKGKQKKEVQQDFIFAKTQWETHGYI